MNAKIKALYQEFLLDHAKNPRNFGEPDPNLPCCSAEAHNPLCGDTITIYLQIENDRIVDAFFSGSGCAISRASASLMTEALKGKTIKTAKATFEDFHALLTTDKKIDLGKLSILSGVKAFPMRIKCATLAWHTAMKALENKENL